MSMKPLAHTLLAPILRDARDMLLLTGAGVRAPSVAALDTAAALGRGIHKAEKDLTERLVFEPAVEMLECAGDLTLTGNRVLARHVEIESLRFEDMANEYARAHEDRLVEGECRPAASSAFLAILDYLREITRHARLIAGRITPRPAPGEGPFSRL